MCMMNFCQENVFKETEKVCVCVYIYIYIYIYIYEPVTKGAPA